MEVKKTESTLLTQRIKELKGIRNMVAIISTCLTLTLAGELGYSAVKGEIDFDDTTTYQNLMDGEDWNNADMIGITAFDVAAAWGTTLLVNGMLKKKRKRNKITK